MRPSPHIDTWQDNYREFHELTLRLIELHERRYALLRAEGCFARIKSATLLASEFRTVQVNIGRRAGKSEFIRRYATARDAIVVANPSQRREFLGQTVLTPHTLRHGHARGRTFNRIYVDEPTLVFEKMPSGELYCELAPTGATFVLLGE